MLQGLIFHYKDLTRLSRAVHLCKGDYLYILLLQDLGQLYPGFYIIRELFCHLLQVLLQLQIYHYFSIIFLKQQTFRPTFQKSIIGLNLAMLAATKKDPHPFSSFLNSLICFYYCKRTHLSYVSFRGVR